MSGTGHGQRPCAPCPGHGGAGTAGYCDTGACHAGYCHGGACHGGACDAGHCDAGACHAGHCLVGHRPLGPGRPGVPPPARKLPLRAAAVGMRAQAGPPAAGRQFQPPAPGTRHPVISTGFGGAARGCACGRSASCSAGFAGVGDAPGAAASGGWRDELSRLRAAGSPAGRRAGAAAVAGNVGAPSAAAAGWLPDAVAGPPPALSVTT